MNRKQTCDRPIQKDVRAQRMHEVPWLFRLYHRIVRHNLKIIAWTSEHLAVPLLSTEPLRIGV